ncbi:MAG: GmrSD restriction endonuclease domain-containing protein [Pseudomonas sp.]
MIFFNPDNSQRNIRVSMLREWLDWAAGNKPEEWHVSLPMIQRGFVWKPLQIIQLWDTLFQGLPFGALLISELPENAKSIALVGGSESLPYLGYGRLGLVDGQQRTLAMLSGWPLPANTPFSHRVWVDFADAPNKGELLSLRITTRNQPFGYTRDNPNAKLSLSDRRHAMAAWSRSQASDTYHETGRLPDFHHTQPWTTRKSLPMDVRVLIQWWQACNGQSDVWKQKVLSHLQSILPAHTASAPESSSVWEQLKENDQLNAIERIDILAKGLDRIDEAQLPLLRVDERLFAFDESDSTEPPLALLFKRIGSNSTKLSDDDYVYAILKHLRPEVHQMVTELHEHNTSNGHGSVASLMSSTDLAMTALRLACATYPESSTDPESPSKDDFHKLIKRDGFLDKAFLPVLNGGVMRQYFEEVLSCLDYRGGVDPGLPRHALPHLSRPLVQVLLRLAQIGCLGSPDCSQDQSRRGDTLRFVLQWWLCIKDHHKASRKAYQVVAKAIQDKHLSDAIGYRMMTAIVSVGAALAMPSPNVLKARPGLTHTTDEFPIVVQGGKRFEAFADDEADKHLCDFWHHWCSPWSHRHPLLLWLQRSYVSEMGGDPVAGRDEDTPYDYDHLLPSLHWSDWTGYAKGTRILEFLRRPSVIGNCIGNIRVWGSSDNRSDGAAAPAKKLQLVPEAEPEEPWVRTTRLDISSDLLSHSAIEPDQADLWVRCLPEQGAAHRCWSLERTKYFEIAVEQRAFSLYTRFYQEPDFQSWAIKGESSDAFTREEAIQPL